MTDQTHQPADNLGLQSFGNALFALHQNFQHYDNLQQNVAGLFLDKLVDQIGQNAVLFQHMLDAFSVLSEVYQSFIDLALDNCQLVVNQFLELSDAVAADDGLATHRSPTYLFLCEG